MSKRMTQPPGLAFPPGDPRRPLKIKRLREAKGRVNEFASREPLLDDPAFEEWEHASIALLQELFGAGNYLLRFRRLEIRAISYNVHTGRRWNGNYKDAWSIGLKQAETLLDEALEEAAIELPVSEPDGSRKAEPAGSVVVNVSNVFSPSFHVTLPVLLDQLGQLPLTLTEKFLATEELS